MQSTNPTLFSQMDPRGSLMNIYTNVGCVRVISAQGMSLLYANTKTSDEMVFALELLRGFRAAGRRVVLCDTSQLTVDSQAVASQLGQDLVNDTDAELLITCGPDGRDVAVGARDAGLDLASVVVCQEAAGACQVLAGRLIPGDTVLLLGIQQLICDQFVESLHKRLSFAVAAAA